MYLLDNQFVDLLLFYIVLQLKKQLIYILNCSILTRKSNML